MAHHRLIRPFGWLNSSIRFLRHTTMASLHITNITGHSLSFTCSSLLAYEQRNLDHKSKATVFISSPGGRVKRPKIHLHARPLGNSTAEKASHFDGNDTTWTFMILRPRSWSGKRSWSFARPLCQHGSLHSRCRADSPSCCSGPPWNVYVLHVRLQLDLVKPHPVTK